MEIFVPVLVLLIGLSFIWFLITGIIVIVTGRDISIGDLPGFIMKRRTYDNSREEYHNILLNRFRYYQKLPDELRPRFLRRVSDFAATREFTGHESITLTTEHKVLISASAVQLTFGLDKYLLEHFRRVILYPKEYFSRQGGNYHKGEVNIQGAIILSMEDFFYGLDTDNDGINLGIHEMAHALQLELFLQEDYENFFGSYYIKWQQEAEKERLAIADQTDGLLRDYAGTNMAEFFAVCAENFFERPKEFKAMKPELYQRFSILLNQDPADATSLIIPPRVKLSEENSIPVDPGKLLYQSGFPTSNVWLETAIMLFYIIIISLVSKNILVPIMLCGSLGAIAILRLTAIKRLILYENYLLVRPVIFPFFRGSSYDYKRIIQLSMHAPKAEMVLISYFTNGSIRQKGYSFSDNEKGSNRILEILTAKGVIIR